MILIRSIAVIILISLFLASCGRPGGRGEENAPGSYLQVTSVTLSGDTVTITVENRFKDPSITSNINPLYNVTLRSYTITYFREDGSIILSSTKNNSIFIFIPVNEKAEDVPITLVPGPSSISYSSASVHIFGTNGFGDKIGTTFFIPTLGGGGGITPTNPAPTITSISPNSGARGATLDITINGTNFVSTSTVSFSGTGITINSTTFVSTTQLKVNITIDSAATTGSRTVTVTNPDMQSATGSFAVT